MSRRPLTIDEKHLYNELVEVIAEELFARIAAQSRLETVDDARAVAASIADGVWHRFEVAERPA